MILKKHNSYLGLQSYDTYITDNSLLSKGIFNVSSLPDEFTAGKNLFKINPNIDILEQDSSILIEIVDSINNTIYYEIPNYFDSNNNRLVVPFITGNTPPGNCIITILGKLKNVPDEYKFKYNIKWSTSINVVPNKHNTSEIIYINPPVVTVASKLKPVPDTVYRNNEFFSIQNNISSYVRYIAPVFEEYTGLRDSSKILQPSSVSKLLFTYVSGSNTGSITSFGTRADSSVYLDQSYGFSISKRNSPSIYFSSFELDSNMNGAKLIVMNPAGILPNTGSAASTNTRYETYIENIINNNTAKTISPFIINASSSVSNNLIRVNSFDNSIFSIQYPNNKIPFAVQNVTMSTDTTTVLNAFFDIHVNNMNPISGDVTRINVYAKESQKPGEYQQLDSYAFDLVDTLMDINYINHITNINSPYRLTGYFSPTLLLISQSIYDSSSFSTQQFSSSYWANTNSTNITALALSSSLYNFYLLRDTGSWAYNNTTASFTCGSTALLGTSSAGVIAFTGSNWQNLPTSSLYPVTYRVTFDINSNSTQLDVGSTLYGIRFVPILYSSSINILGTGRIDITASNLVDIYKDNNNTVNVGYYTGSYTGYLTVPANMPVSFGMYAYQPNSSPSKIPSGSISNIQIKEIGQYSDILTSYWALTSSSNSPAGQITASRSPLLDSALISPLSTPLNNSNTNDYYLFKTKHGYMFYENTDYVIRFNAQAQRDSSGKVPNMYVYGINSGSYNPFTYTVNNLGLNIGYIKLEYDENTKYFDQVEMYFTCTNTGYGHIAFQINQGIWSLSNISVKELDPIGYTPNHVRILAKVPGIPSDYEGSKLTFKLEYYDSANNQSKYTTFINEVGLTNINTNTTQSGNYYPYNPNIGNAV